MKTFLRLISLTCLTLVLMPGLFEVRAQVSLGRIAFVRGGDIYTADSSGTNALNLTNNAAGDHSPQYSFDGSKIVFVSNRDGNNEIYVMNQNGSNPTRLTNNTASD